MKQAWIHSPVFDVSFILAPAILITVAVLLFADNSSDTSQISPLLFAVLIVGVDVSHVYGTLFRSYLDKDERQARKGLYTVVPLLCWLSGAWLYGIGAPVFWRALAYLAVFHFVRQQYGFMMIYGRTETLPSRWLKTIDKAAIYLATIYPLIYWHTQMPRNFNWFVEGDFIAIRYGTINAAAFALYVAVLAVYVGKECVMGLRGHGFNLPKNLLLFGTALSWWVGIIHFNNDLAFTAINVVAHGIPYMALIWIYGRKQSELKPSQKILGIARRTFFSSAALPLFLGILFMLAYLEEGLWDAWVWTEHTGLFRPLHTLPSVTDEKTLVWLVPLLALPQTTHYVLDAFIWRMRAGDTHWKNLLFQPSRHGH